MSAKDSASEQQMFIKIKDIPKYEPALTIGGIRHLIQHRESDLRREGVIVNFGRLLFIVLPELRRWLAAGGAQFIAGTRR